MWLVKVQTIQICNFLLHLTKCQRLFYAFFLGIPYAPLYQVNNIENSTLRLSSAHRFSFYSVILFHLRWKLYKNISSFSHFCLHLMHVLRMPYSMTWLGSIFRNDVAKLAVFVQRIFLHSLIRFFTNFINTSIYDNYKSPVATPARHLVIS